MHQTLKMFRAILPVSLLVFGVGGSVPAQEISSAFFPARPPGTEPLTEEGVLLDYNVGNIAGGFIVQHDGEEIDFYTANGMRIDGKAIRCLVAPSETFHPDPQYCPDWPADIQLGKTQVKVAYWYAEYHDQRVRVSDRIDALR